MKEQQPLPANLQHSACATHQITAYERQCEWWPRGQEAAAADGEGGGGSAEPAALVMTARAKVPLLLLGVVMWLHGTLVWLRLCNSQGVALFSFVRLPPRVPRPLARAADYSMSLTRAERLCALGCGFKGKLVRLLSLGVGRHFEPQRNWGACHKMMQSNVRRVAAGLAAAVLDRLVKEAERLLAAAQYAAAAAQLQRAIALGHLPSRAHLADLFLHAREGFAKDREERV